MEEAMGYFGDTILRIMHKQKWSRNSNSTSFLDFLINSEDEECTILKRQLFEFMQEKLREKSNATVPPNNELENKEEIKEEVKVINTKKLPVITNCYHKLNENSKATHIKYAEGLGSFKDYFNFYDTYKGTYHDYRILNNLKKEAEMSWSNSLTVKEFNIDNVFFNA